MSDKAVPGPVLAWEEFKDWLSATAHLSHHELHVVVGLMLFVFFARLSKRSFSSMLPLLPIAALELINEAFDFARYYTSGWPWTPHETIVDIALTLAPPTALVILDQIMRSVRKPSPQDPV